MMFEEGFVDCPDSYRLHVGLRRDKAPRGWVVVAHGFGEHFERYGEVAAFLNELHLSVFAFDFRGYGRSEGGRGAIDSYDDYVEDYQAALAYLKLQEGVEQAHLLGHSQGGLITTYFLKKTGYQPKSVVLSSPGLRFVVQVPLWKRLAGEVASRLVPTLGLPSGIDPYTLTHDRAVCQAYEQDPLVLKNATARWYTESIRAQNEVLARPFEAAYPVLMLQGTDDRLVDPRTNKIFFETLSAPRKEYKEYEGFYHECLNEVDRKRVYADLKAWYESLLG
jgi:alpha-beta hydrolase superfamily lysophospholipase